MGGCCCCCASRRSEPPRAPTYYYCPRTSEERQPLSAHHGTSGLLVDTNLDTTDPDTYTPPPAPIPFESYLGHPRVSSPHESGVNYGTMSGSALEAGRIDAGSAEGPTRVGSPEIIEKDPECKTESILELTPSKDIEDDLKKPAKSIAMTIEEEDCPICLEEYTDENPKMLTSCEHHFHLCCILEWMERSENCPVCDQEILIDDAFGS